MGTQKFCDAIFFQRGPRKCGRLIEDGTGCTLTIQTSNKTEVYELCKACFNKIYRVLNPTGDLIVPEVKQ